MSRIYLSAPDVSDAEGKFALEAIMSGWLAPAGPDLPAFESEVAARVGTAHAVALSPGSAALYLALLCLGARPGDVVLTSTMTFAATANVIVYTGAQPWFVDCNRADGNIDLALLADAALGSCGPSDCSASRRKTPSGRFSWE